MKILLTSLFVLIVLNKVYAMPLVGQSYWHDLSRFELIDKPSIDNVLKKSSAYKRLFRLDIETLKNVLIKKESTTSSKKAHSKTLPLVIELPLPNGRYEQLRLTEYSLLSSELQSRYPDIKTWKMKGVDNSSITGRLDLTASGIHGMLLMPDGDTVYIDPEISREKGLYRSASKKENKYHSKGGFKCDVLSRKSVTSNRKPLQDKGTVKKELLLQPALDLITYRLALAGTAEYTASQGGTRSSAYFSMVTQLIVSMKFTKEILG